MNLKSERFEMRFDPDLLERVDLWREMHDPSASRAEAIRVLVKKGLKRADQPELSDGEALIVHLVCELMKRQNLGAEFDPSFIMSALGGGHNWALEWEYPNIFHHHIDKRSVVGDVINYLDMWSFLEEAFEALDKVDRELIKAETGYDKIEFNGFDGNNETEHFSIALFLIEKMGRFGRFAGRGNNNSHTQVIDRFAAMYRTFEPIRATLIGRPLTAIEIIKVINSHRRAI